MSSRIALALAAVCLLGLTGVSSACDKPDGTIELSTGTVAVGIGYSWGSGTLRYQGRSIPVTLKGLSVASVGAGSVRASGEVCNLAKLSDFDGNYTAISAGAAVGGGVSAAAMQNQNGVVIRLHSTNQGLQLNLSLEGVAIRVAGS